MPDIARTHPIPCVLPAPLKSGGTVRIVAPSGPFDPALFASGAALLKEHYQVVSEPQPRVAGFLAGTDEERLRELQAALDDPELDCIWVARGGYGISRILSDLKWEGFLKRPKWIVGFSDVTALHMAALGRGIACLHAANVTTLTRPGSEFAELRTLLAHEGPASPLPGALSNEASTAVETAPVYGGNLTVLFAEAAAGRLQLPPGCALLLEDVTETSYRIDRMLTALRIAGHLDHVSAVLLGEFQDCSPGKFQVPVDEVLSGDAFPGVPLVVRHLPIGHGERNRGIILGRPAALMSAPR